MRKRAHVIQGLIWAFRLNKFEGPKRNKPSREGDFIFEGKPTIGVEAHNFSSNDEGAGLKRGAIYHRRLKPTENANAYWKLRALSRVSPRSNIT
jgi:hypothetical protein